MVPDYIIIIAALIILADIAVHTFGRWRIHRMEQRFRAGHRRRTLK